MTKVSKQISNNFQECDQVNMKRWKSKYARHIGRHTKMSTRHLRANIFEKDGEKYSIFISIRRMVDDRRRQRAQFNEVEFYPRTEDEEEARSRAGPLRERENDVAKEPPPTRKTGEPK